MIVFISNKGYQTRDDKPNENWMEDQDVFVVPDGSELAEKIISNYPNFDFVVDEAGELIDITPTEAPPIPAPPPPPPTDTEIAIMEAIAEQYEAGLKRDADILAAYEATVELYEMMQGGGV